MSKSVTTTARLRERLDGLADVIVLGVAAAVCAMGVVTAFAGLLAAAQVLAEPDDEQPVLRRFRRAVARRWRFALFIQLLWTIAAVVAGVDLLGVAVVPLSLRPIVTGIGVLLLLAAVILPPFLAAAAVQIAGGPRGRAESARATVSVAVLAAAGRPLRSLAVLGLVLLGVAAIQAVAVLTPLVGILVVAALRVAGPAVAAVDLRLGGPQLTPRAK